MKVTCCLIHQGTTPAARLGGSGERPCREGREGGRGSYADYKAINETPRASHAPPTSRCSPPETGDPPCVLQGTGKDALKQPTAPFRSRPRRPIGGLTCFLRGRTTSTRAIELAARESRRAPHGWPPIEVAGPLVEGLVSAGVGRSAASRCAHARPAAGAAAAS